MHKITKFFLFVVMFSVTCNVASSQVAQAPRAGRSVFRYLIPKNYPTRLITLSDNEIARLATLAKEPKKLGQEVGAIVNARGLSGTQRVSFLEDTFLRVALTNGVLKKEQEVAIRKMFGTRGLSSLLGKINSSNANQVKGHLKELEVGIGCQARGGKVIAFGRKFDDGVKQNATDLDVYVRVQNKNFAIESKAYSTDIGADMVRKDIESLTYFCTKLDNKAIPVFVFDKAPPPVVARLLQTANIKHVHGTSEEICSQIEMLSRLH